MFLFFSPCRVSDTRCLSPFSAPAVAACLSADRPTATVFCPPYLPAGHLYSVFRTRRLSASSPQSGQFVSIRVRSTEYGVQTNSTSTFSTHSVWTLCSILYWYGVPLLDIASCQAFCHSLLWQWTPAFSSWPVFPPPILSSLSNHQGRSSPPPEGHSVTNGHILSSLPPWPLIGASWMTKAFSDAVRSKMRTTVHLSYSVLLRTRARTEYACCWIPRRLFLAAPGWLARPFRPIYPHPPPPSARLVRAMPAGVSFDGLGSRTR